ncbi:hypothetical protein HUJ05_013346, partial [Dendroctonus ponderosae]
RPGTFRKSPSTAVSSQPGTTPIATQLNGAPTPGGVGVSSVPFAPGSKTGQPLEPNELPVGDESLLWRRFARKQLETSEEFKDLSKPKQVQPWTEEQIVLKKAKVEHREPVKEKLEEVHLKVSKPVQKEIPRAVLEDVELKPVSLEKHITDSFVAQSIEQAQVAQQDWRTAPKTPSSQIRSATEDSTLLTLDQKQQEHIVKTTPEPAQKDWRTPKPADIAAELKRQAWRQTLEKQDSVEIDIDTVLAKAQHAVRKIPTPQPQQAKIIPWTEEKITLKAAPKDQIAKFKEIPKEKLEDVVLKPVTLEEIQALKQAKLEKPREPGEPVPWIEEDIDLKPTPQEKKEIPKETLEEVHLKSVDLTELLETKLTPLRLEGEGIPWTEEEISLNPTLHEKKEIPKETLEEVALKPITKIPDIRDTELKSLITERKPGEPIPWTEEEIRLKHAVIEKKEITKEQLEDFSLKPLAQIPSQKPAEPLPVQQEIQEKTLEIQLEQQEISKQKSAAKTEIRHVEDRTLLDITKHTSELMESQPEVKTWERGAKPEAITSKQTTETTQKTIIESQQVQDTDTKAWKRETVVQKEEHQHAPKEAPAPWNEQPITLKKTTIERKQTAKETIEQVDLKPSRPVKTGDTVVQTTEQTQIAQFDTVERTAVLSATEDTTLLQVTEHEKVSQSLTLEEKSWKRAPKTEKPTVDATTVQHIEDASRLIFQERVEEHGETVESKTWQRGTKAVGKLEEQIAPVQHTEDTTLVSLQEKEVVKEEIVEAKPWKRGPKTTELLPKEQQEKPLIPEEIKPKAAPKKTPLAREDEPIPWNKQEISLKPTPKKSVEETTKIEEVSLTPIKKPVRSVDDKQIITSDVQEEITAAVQEKPSEQNEKLSSIHHVEDKTVIEMKEQVESRKDTKLEEKTWKRGPKPEETPLEATPEEAFVAEKPKPKQGPKSTPITQQEEPIPWNKQEISLKPTPKKKIEDAPKQEEILLTPVKKPVRSTEDKTITTSDVTIEERSKIELKQPDLKPGKPQEDLSSIHQVEDKMFIDMKEQVDSKTDTKLEVKSWTRGPKSEQAPLEAKPEEALVHEEPKPTQVPQQDKILEAKPWKRGPKPTDIKPKEQQEELVIPEEIKPKAALDKIPLAKKEEPIPWNKQEISLKPTPKKKIEEAPKQEESSLTPVKKPVRNIEDKTLITSDVTVEEKPETGTQKRVTKPVHKPQEKEVSTFITPASVVEEQLEPKAWRRGKKPVGKQPEESVEETITELPEEIRETKTVTDGLEKKTIERTRVIKKKKGNIEETTQIVTVQEEGKTPQTTVTVVESIAPEETQPFYVVEELPTKVQETTVIEQGIPKKIIERKRVIETKKGDRKDVTEIIVTQKPGDKPITSVTVKNVPVVKQEPIEPEYVVQELPVQILETVVTDASKTTKKVVKTRTIQKQKDGIKETTQIVTAVEDGKKPEHVVTTEQHPAIEEESIFTVRELPLEILESTVIESGIPKHRTTKKRVIEKVIAGKKEITEIITTEQDDKPTETTVTVTEQDIKKRPKKQRQEQPKEEVIPWTEQVQLKRAKAKKPQESEEEDKVELKQIPTQPSAQAIIEELPEQIQVSTTVDKGKIEKTVTKTRVIKKRKGSKEETTQIVTVEKEGNIPETTIVTEKQSITEEQTTQPIYSVKELPEEVFETTVIEEGVPKKITERKRVIKTRKDNKQEITQITTVEREDRPTETVVTITESEATDFEEMPIEQEFAVEELPTEIYETTIIEKGKPKTVVEKKRRIKKMQDDKVQTTEIITVEEPGKKPKTTVRTFEDTTQTIQDLEKPLIEELPEDVQEVTVIDAGVTKKKLLTKKTLKKTKGDKEETTEIVTLEEEGQKPETVVTVTEEIIDKKKPQKIPVPQETVEIPWTKQVELKQTPKTNKPEEETREEIRLKPVKKSQIPQPEEAPVVQELPEEIQQTTVIDKGEAKVQVTKTRVIKKRTGDKEETTQIVTVAEDGKEPQTTVTVEEQEVPEAVATQPIYKVEELPEKISESTVVVQGIERRKVEKRRVIKTTKGKTQELTEVLTTQLEGEKPEVTITVHEIEDTLPETLDETFETVEELPVQISETVVVDKGIRKKKVAKTRTIRKEKDGKQQITEIVTIEEEGKNPDIQVTVHEEDKPVEKTVEKPVTDLPWTEQVKLKRTPKKQQEAPVESEIIKLKPVKPEITDTPVTIEELPEEIHETVVTDKGKIRKQTSKKRVIKKRVGDKEETTQIVTIQEEGKAPQTTVTIENVTIPEKEVVQPIYKVEEEPEQILETSVIEDGVRKKQVQKKRVIKTTKGDKQEVTEIVVLEQEGKKPEVTVRTEEIDAPKIPSEQPEDTSIEELPIEIREDVVFDHGVSKKKVEKKRTIKKKRAGKDEITEIITVEEEGKLPETSIVTYEQVPEEDSEKPFIKELPEETQQVVVVDEGVTKQKTIRKRIIRKRKGDKDEITEIVTLEEEGKLAETTVSITEDDRKPDQIKPKRKPKKVEVSEILPVVEVEELPEEVQETIVIDKGVAKKQIKKKRVIKKRRGSKEETTEIVTVEEEGKAPQIQVQVEEVQIPEEMAEQPIYTVEELPEQVSVSTVIEGGLKKQKVQKKRIIKTRKGNKQEITELTTTEMEGKAPSTTVTITEVEAPADEVPVQTEYVVEELPIETQEVISVDGGVTSKTVIKKRTLKKRKDGKEQITEIVTVQEDGKKPETTVTISEDFIHPDTIFLQPLVEELPEQISEIIVDKKGIKEKQVIKKRVIKKRKGSKDEVTEIITLEQEGKKPETTVTVTEEETPRKPKKRVIEQKKADLPWTEQVKLKRAPKQIKPAKEKGETVELKPVKTEEVIQELPEEIQETTVFDQGVMEKKVTKKRVIKKRKGSKDETLEILTVQEEGKQPETTVTIIDETPKVPDVTLKRAKKEKVKLAKGTDEKIEKLHPAKMVQPDSLLTTMEELPTEVRETTVIEDGITRKQKTRKRVIKKRRGSKEETTEIVTVEEEGKVPQTTVTIEEDVAPKIAEEQPLYRVEELPEEVYETTVVEQGRPQKKIIKKRVIKTKKGDKQEITEIVITQKGREAPVTEVIIHEESIPFEEIEQPEYAVEELPVEIQETVVVKDGISKKRVEKKRTIKKKDKQGKDELTEIVTIHEEGKKPQTTVTVQTQDTVSDIPDRPVITELPEEISEVNVVEQGVIKQKIKTKRTIKKRRGSKDETTEIVVIEEEGKAPLTTVLVTEEPVEDQQLIPKPKIKKTKKQAKSESPLVTPEGYLFVPSLAHPKETQPDDVVDMLQTELIKMRLAKNLPEHVVPDDVPKYTVMELPEEVQETTVIQDGVSKKVRSRKRVIKKRIGDKEETTEIVSVEEEGKVPQTTVTVEEETIPEDIPEQPIYSVEELPEEISETTVLVEGRPKKRIEKKKTIKTRKGSKQEITEITVTEQEGKRPVTEVSIKEIDIPESEIHEGPQPEYLVEELPIEIKETVVVENGVSKKTVQKKRTIKKRKGDKEEITEIVTSEQEDEAPRTIVSIEEKPITFQLEEVPKIVEELPTVIQEVRIIEDGVPQKKTIKKRVIKKRRGSKEEKTEIVTVEQEGKLPETTVTVDEITVIEEKKPKVKKPRTEKVEEVPWTEQVQLKPSKRRPKAVEKTQLEEVDLKPFEVPEKEEEVFRVEELPVEIKETTVIDQKGVSKKKIVKKRVISKQKGDKHERTEIVTVEEEGKAPETTVITEEIDAPKTGGPLYIVEELPVDVQES